MQNKINKNCIIITLLMIFAVSNTYSMLKKSRVKRSYGDCTEYIRDGINLIAAIYTGNYDQVKNILDNYNIDFQDDYNTGHIPLVHAISHGDENIVKLLISYGARINFIDKHGYVPLIFACNFNNLSLTKLLIDYGANVNLSDEDGDVALLFASENGNEDMLNLLISHDANINLQNGNGYSALMLAAHAGETDIVKRLIDLGADLNLQNNNGDTALKIAIDMNHEDIIRLLVDRGAKINLDTYLDKPLDATEKAKFRDIGNLLKRYRLKSRRIG